MIPTVERILFLNKIPLFEGFSVDELWQVAQALEEMRYEPGELLFEEGKPGDALYLIVSGEVVGSLAGNDVAKFGTESVLGDIAVLDGGPYGISLSATTETVAIKIEREKLDDILNANPSAARGVIAILCKKIRYMGEQAFEAAKQNPRSAAENLPTIKL